MIIFEGNVINLEEEIKKAKWERLTLDIIDILIKKYKLTEDQAVVEYNNHLEFSFKKFNFKK